MSSLARRSIRTTAAAAGIAALGIGIAGPALAAPSVADLPALDPTSAPAVDTAVPGMADFTKVADTAPASMAELPGAFAFEAPSLDTASVPSVESLSIPTEMNAAALPSAPDTSGVVNTDGTGFDVQGVPNVQDAAGTAGALAALDTAKTFADLAQKAASGESVTANNDISN